jgi:CheY-like chemotaxis protein
MSAVHLCILVDDDHDFLALTYHCVARICPKCEIVAFGNGLDALALLAQRRADVLITDYRMPFIDGLCLTARARSLDRNISIVVISGDDIGPQAVAEGANAFVQKRDMAQKLGPMLERLGVFDETHDTASCRIHAASSPDH